MPWIASSLHYVALLAMTEFSTEHPQLHKCLIKTQDIRHKKAKPSVKTEGFVIKENRPRK